MITTVTRLVASAELLGVAEDLVAGLVKAKRISPERAGMILGDLPQLKHDLEQQRELIDDTADRLMDRVERIVGLLLQYGADLSADDIAKLERLRIALRG